MDTHIKDADLTDAGIGLASPIGLPGEGRDGRHDRSGSQQGDIGGHHDAEAAPPPPPAKKARRSSRGPLLAGVAIIVLGTLGAGAYVFRDTLRPFALTHLARVEAHLPAWNIGQQTSSVARPHSAGDRRGARAASAPPRCARIPTAGISGGPRPAVRCARQGAGSRHDHARYGRGRPSVRHAVQAGRPRGGNGRVRRAEGTSPERRGRCLRSGDDGECLVSTRFRPAGGGEHAERCEAGSGRS